MSTASFMHVAPTLTECPLTRFADIPIHAATRSKISETLSSCSHGTGSAANTNLAAKLRGIYRVLPGQPLDHFCLKAMEYAFGHQVVPGL